MTYEVDPLKLQFPSLGFIRHIHWGVANIYDTNEYQYYENVLAKLSSCYGSISTLIYPSIVLHIEYQS